MTLTISALSLTWGITLEGVSSGGHPADLRERPVLDACEGRPKKASFSSPSGTSVTEPSTEMTRSPQQDTPIGSRPRRGITPWRGIWLHQAARAWYPAAETGSPSNGRLRRGGCAAN
ncbi:MAG: hypothetical protein ACRDOE_03725 [Streptosporangiaceae bacterium]